MNSQESYSRYIVPDPFKDTVTVREEKAREAAEQNDVDWSDVQVDHDLQILHAVYSWTYWSDDSMTAGLDYSDRKKLDDLSAEGSGQFSEDAEELLSNVWSGGEQSIAELGGGKEQLAAVSEARSNMLDSIDERYGLVSYRSNHSVWIERVVALREGELGEFFHVEAHYAGMAPDGFHDEKHWFFDEEKTARKKFRETYGTRKARRVQFKEALHEFKSRYRDPKYIFLDEDLNEIEPSTLLFPEAADNEDVEKKIRTDLAPIKRRYKSSESVLLYGINHYVPTGPDFGEGLIDEVDFEYIITVSVPEKPDQGMKLPWDTRTDFAKLLLHLRELDSDVRVENRGTPLRGDRVWYDIVVPLNSAFDIGDALAEEPGPAGWGTPKTEILDEHPPLRGARF